MLDPMGSIPGAGPFRAIGRYALHGAIASGGMATVHLGRLLGAAGFSRTVAIKRLHAQYAQDPQFVMMFVDEARLAGRIRHPNVVPTLDVVAAEDELFLVMEYVEGESLARLIKASTRRGEVLPLPVACSIMAGVLHGLHAAHEARDERGEPLGIVHRDISPQNVLVGTDGTARIVDFGVAKATGRLQTTREGQLKGKLTYMAPELFGGARPERQVDIYAAAVVLWEAVVGRRLFAGETDADTVGRILGNKVEPASRHVAGVPPELDAVILRGLDADPARRFVTARDMATALETAAPIALPVVVGAWVERWAKEVLAERAVIVAGIESSSEQNPPLAAAASQATSPDEATTGISQTALSHTSDLGHARSRRRSSLVVALGVAGGLAVGATLVWLVPRRVAAPPVAASVATPPPVAPASAAPAVVVGAPPVPSASAVDRDEPPPPAPSTNAPPQRNGPMTPAAPARPIRKGPVHFGTPD
jgi:serine/threonine protein kinase